jgi:DNA polymerase-1
MRRLTVVANPSNLSGARRGQFSSTSMARAVSLKTLNQIQEKVLAIQNGGGLEKTPNASLPFSKKELEEYLAFLNEPTSTAASAAGPGESDAYLKTSLASMKRHLAEMSVPPKEIKKSESDLSYSSGEIQSIAAVSTAMPIILFSVVHMPTDGAGIQPHYRFFAPELNYVENVLAPQTPESPENIDYFTLARNLSSALGKAAATMIFDQEDSKWVTELAKNLSAAGFQIVADASVQELANCFLAKSDGIRQSVGLARETEEESVKPAEGEVEGDSKAQEKLPPQHLRNCTLELLRRQFAPPNDTTVGKGIFASPAGWTLLGSMLGEAKKAGVLDIGSRSASLKEAVTALTYPIGDVVIVSLISVGGVVNFSSLNLMTGQRTQAYGGREDVLDGLLNISRSGNLIIIPNPTADDYLLQACRVQLMKMGKVIFRIWPTTFHDKLGSGRCADPARHRDLICDMLKWKVADLILNAKMAAARQTRKRVSSHTAEYLDLMAASTQEVSAESGEVVLPTVVKNYLEMLYSPERLAVEGAATQAAQRFLIATFKVTPISVLNRTGNPHSDKNFIYAAGYIDYQGNKWAPYQVHRDRSGCKFPSLADYDVIVVHDARDALILLWDDPELKQFLKRGGKIWDTLLGEYLLSAQRVGSGDSSLTKLATNYGVTVPGSDLPAEADPAQFALLQIRFQVNRELISIAGVYRGQLTRSRDQVQTVSLRNRMDAMLAFVELERNGIYIDEPVALRLAAERHNAGVEADAVLQLHIPSAIPIDLWPEFNWNSGTTLHSYFWGGTVTFGKELFYRSHLVNRLLVEVSYLAKTFDGLNQTLIEEYAVTEKVETGIPSSEANGDKQHQQAVKSQPEALKQDKRAGHIIRDAVHKHLQKKFNSGKDIPSALTKFRIVFFDLETTGTDARGDRIVEYCFHDLATDKWLSSLVNPEQPLTSENSAIHGIQDDMLVNAPKFADVAQSISDFLETKEDDMFTILLSHNTWNLDEPILRKELLQARINLQKVVFADTLELFKRMSIPGDRSFRLSELIKRFRVTTGQSHRAQSDVSALEECVFRGLKVQADPKPEQVFSLLKAIVAENGSGTVKPYAEKVPSLTITLPGVVHKYFPLTAKEMLSTYKNSSVDDEVLNMFARRGCEAASLLLVKRQQADATNKLLTLQQNTNSLLFLYPDGCVHQTVSLCSTATSRNSSSNPSLQNIPKDDKSDIRKIFKSRFGAEGCIVEIDYAALEIAVQAVLSGDPNLLSELRSGIDFHLKRASWLDPKKRSYEELVRLKKEGDKEVIALRRKAKTISFQRLYGAGAVTISRSAGVSREEVDAMIEAEQRTYPGIVAFQKLVRVTALRVGNPGLPTHYVFELPTGCRMAFTARDAHHDLPTMKNYPIQGYAAELVQAMLGKLFRHLSANDFYDNKVRLINFVHDSVWFDCHTSVVSRVVEESEAILSSIKPTFEKMYPNVKIPLDLTVATEAGFNMYEMHSFDKFLTLLRSRPAAAQTTVESEPPITMTGGLKPPSESNQPGAPFVPDTSQKLQIEEKNASAVQAPITNHSQKEAAAAPPSGAAEARVSNAAVESPTAAISDKSKRIRSTEQRNAQIIRNAVARRRVTTKAAKSKKGPVKTAKPKTNPIKRVTTSGRKVK